MYKPIKIPIMGRHRIHNDSVYITKAANGYIVDLPEEDNFSDMDYPEVDLRHRLADPKWIYDMVKIFNAAKNGEPFPEQTLDPATGPIGNRVNQEPQNTRNVFATWAEAAAFIEDYYK